LIEVVFKVVGGDAEEFGAEKERDKKDEGDEKRGLQARTHPAVIRGGAGGVECFTMKTEL
jgi:hypothetical protein